MNIVRQRPAALCRKREGKWGRPLKVTDHDSHIGVAVAGCDQRRGKCEQSSRVLAWKTLGPPRAAYASQE